jgi:tetratricopeptide (TPR) repeat protein
VFRRWYFTLMVPFLVLLLMLAWWMLPYLFDILPLTIQSRLPDELLVLVTTPLPTALPAPINAESRAVSRITSVPIVDIQPTLTATMEEVRPEPTDFVVQKLATLSPIPTIQPTATSIVAKVPDSARISGLQIMPQKFNNCGPATLTIAINFYGYSAEQLKVAEVLKPNYYDRNVSPSEMVKYVNEKTPLRAATYSGGDIFLLKRLIASGFPVILEKGLIPSEWQGWMGHYLTVFGYDDQNEEFQSLDTFLGPWDSSGRSESYDSIQELWSHFNFTFIVVYEPQEEESLYEIIGPDLLDPITMWHQSAKNAQASLEKNPENAFTWFNLGSSLSELAALSGDATYYIDAAASFDRAREIGLPFRMLWYQFQPYEAYLASGRLEEVFTLTDATLSTDGGHHVEEAFFYKGKAMLASGDKEGAAIAYQEALDLNPGYLLAKQAVSSLSLDVPDSLSQENTD